MKKIIRSIGFIAAIIAITLAVTSVPNTAITPMIVAFLCGLTLTYITKNQKTKPKVIQYIFLLSLFTLVLLIYKNTTIVKALDQNESHKQDPKNNSDNSEGKLEDITAQ